MNKKCKGCFVSFTPKSNHNVYCYDCCHFTCTTCKKVIWRRVASTLDGRNIFCSFKCSAKAKEGYDSLTPEQRKRVADAHRGIPKSEECRKIMQEKALGKRNSQYKNGKYVGKGRGNYDYRKWVKEVFEKYGKKCNLCGNTDEKLHADHILPYSYFPEKKYDIENGQVLCIPCHRKKTSKDQKKYWKNKYAMSEAVKKLYLSRKSKDSAVLEKEDTL